MAFFVPMLAAVGSGSAITGAALLGSTALSVGGAISQARNAKAAASANATMMRQQASLARAQGNARQETQLRRAREILGQQRAAIGQAGVGWGGSAQDVLEQSATSAELDTLNIGYEAELQALGLMNQASITDWEGRQQRNAGYISAASSLLNSTANYFGNKGGSSFGGDGLSQGDRRKIGVY